MMTISKNGQHRKLRNYTFKGETSSPLPNSLVRYLEYMLIFYSLAVPISPIARILIIGRGGQTQISVIEPRRNKAHRELQTRKPETPMSTKPSAGHHLRPRLRPRPPAAHKSLSTVAVPEPSPGTTSRLGPTRILLDANFGHLKMVSRESHSARGELSLLVRPGKDLPKPTGQPNKPSLPPKNPLNLPPMIMTPHPRWCASQRLDQSHKISWWQKSRVYMQAWSWLRINVSKLIPHNHPTLMRTRSSTTSNGRL
jgi:hypothetical protein